MVEIDAVPRSRLAIDAELRWLGLRHLASPFRRASPAAIAIGAALLFAFKLLRVSRGDTTVALAVAQASDKPAAFAGMLVQLAPLLILAVWTTGCFVAAAAFGTLVAAVRDSDPRVGQCALGLLVAGAAALAVSGWLALAVPSWPDLPVAVIVLVAAPVREVRRWRRRSRPTVAPPAWVTRSVWHAGGVLIAAVVAAGLLLMDSLFTGVLSDQMWLPAHRLQTGGSQVVVGYVLSRDNGTVILLRDRDRAIVLIPAGNITGDDVCEAGDRGDPRSAWDAWRRVPQPSLARCATPRAG